MLGEEGGSDRSRWKKCIFGRFWGGREEGRANLAGGDSKQADGRVAETIFLGKKCHTVEIQGEDFLGGRSPNPK